MVHRPGPPGAGPRSLGGKLFKQWRHEHGLTQFAAAQALGLRYNKINRWENSHMFPSLPTAVLIERMTGIPCRAWVEALDDEPAARPSQLSSA